MSDFFESSKIEWKSVSAELATAYQLLWGVPLFLMSLSAGALAYVGSFFADWMVLAFGGTAIALLIGSIWVFLWAKKAQRSWGYAEHEDELVVKHGIVWRRIVFVPFGRMQFVDVTAGPVDRWLGFTNVTLHTASTKTAAKIPGLPPAEASRLRNLLIDRGETDSAGL